jgi:hypothetical protein
MLVTAKNSGTTSHKAWFITGKQKYVVVELDSILLMLSIFVNANAFNAFV